MLLGVDTWGTLAQEAPPTVRMFKKPSGHADDHVMASLAVLVVLVSALLALIPMAMVQRAKALGGGGTTSQPVTSRLGRDSSTTPTAAELGLGRTSKRGRAGSVGQVARGVFFGLWLFTLSVAAIGGVLYVAVSHYFGSR